MSHFQLKVSINKTIKSFQEVMLQEQKKVLKKHTGENVDFS